MNSIHNTATQLAELRQRAAAALSLSEDGSGINFADEAFEGPMLELEWIAESLVGDDDRERVRLGYMLSMIARRFRLAIDLHRDTLEGGETE